MPKRGLAALAITTVALILLISFKTPDEPSARPDDRQPRRSSSRVHGTGTVAGPTPQARLPPRGPGRDRLRRATRSGPHDRW